MYPAVAPPAQVLRVTLKCRVPDYVRSDVVKKDFLSALKGVDCIKHPTWKLEDSASGQARSKADWLKKPAYVDFTVTFLVD